MGHSFDLSGKVGIVTGASRGLGQTFARALARAGADLVITSRTLDSLDNFSERSGIDGPAGGAAGARRARREQYSPHGERSHEGIRWHRHPRQQRRLQRAEKSGRRVVGGLESHSRHEPARRVLRRAVGGQGDDPARPWTDHQHRFCHVGHGLRGSWAVRSESRRHSSTDDEPGR